MVEQTQQVQPIEPPAIDVANANKATEATDDAEFSTKSRGMWNVMSDWYARFERYELPQAICCAELTDLPLKMGPVIEVGCGPGLHSETLARSFLRGSGSTLVSCDFSQAMVQKMEQRYAQSDYKRLDGNKVTIDLATDYASVENTDRVDLARIMQENQPYDKLVYGCMADNMRLPFEDNTFEAYISNLSLMIVQHRERQISEAFRVLKAGSRACFTIWGRPENAQQFQIVRQAHWNLGRELPANAKEHDRYFALSADLDALRQMFVDAGFKADDVRIWYQPGNWWYRDGEDYWNNMGSRMPEHMRDDAIKNEMIRLFNEGKNQMQVFEKCIILVTKP